MDILGHMLRSSKQCNNNGPAAAVQAAFQDARNVSAFDMAKALATLSTPPYASNKVADYVHKAMSEFREKIRKEPLPAIDKIKRSKKAFKLFSNFRLAVSWEQVQNAFVQLSEDGR